MKLVTKQGAKNELQVMFNNETIEEITVNYKDHEAMQQGITLLCRLLAKGDRCNDAARPGKAKQN